MDGENGGNEDEVENEDEDEDVSKGNFFRWGERERGREFGCFESGELVETR